MYSDNIKPEATFFTFVFLYACFSVLFGSKISGFQYCEIVSISMYYQRSSTLFAKHLRKNERNIAHLLSNIFFAGILEWVFPHWTSLGVIVCWVWIKVIEILRINKKRKWHYFLISKQMAALKFIITKTFILYSQ